MSKHFVIQRWIYYQLMSIHKEWTNKKPEILALALSKSDCGASLVKTQPYPEFDNDTETGPLTVSNSKSFKIKFLAA